MLRLYTADTHYFNAGAIADDGIVVKAAPILRWMIGKSVDDLRRFVASKRGTVYEHPIPLPPHLGGYTR